MTTTILRIDASPRLNDSVSRKITDQVMEKLLEADASADVVVRDLATSPVPYVTELMIGGYFAPPEQHTVEMKNAIAISNQYVGELLEADTIVISTPIYNFSVPGSLKAYIDLIVRAGVTFQYGPNGPEGLVENKRVILAVASGGVPMDSPVDFTTPYLRQVLNFIGITDITTVNGTGQSSDEEKLERSQAEVAQIFA